LPLEFPSLRRQVEETLAPILCTRPLDDEFLPDQLTENTAQALLGDAQNAEQLADGHLGVPSNEVDDTMVGTTKTIFCQDRIGLCGEITISEKQELDPLAYLLLSQGMPGDK